MKKRLILSFFYMGLIASIVGITATALVYQSVLKSEMGENLKNECEIVAAGYSDLSSYDRLSVFASDILRITLIDPSGKVLFESEAEAGNMENHLSRPEITEALSIGSGFDIRISDTIGIEDYYYAMKLHDGNILRVSTDARSVFAVVGRSFYLLVLIVTLIIVFSVLISVKLTSKILDPVGRLYSLIEKDKEIDTSTVYPELVPMIDEISAQRRAQEGMRREFTANVSHELKTPLTSISGYAEMIETGIAKDEDIKMFAGKIKSEALRMLTLVSDIIKLSQLDDSETTELCDTIDLIIIANECKDELELEARKKGVEIYIKGKGETFPGNYIQLHEMIFNLMDNAIKYNRTNGNVDVTVSGKTICISDTGIGISEENKSRIFERFFRVDKSRSRKGGGTGLGLSIVKHIAKNHHAEINIESTMNVGTDITIHF